MHDALFVTDLPPLAQQREQVGREHDIAVLSSLAALDTEQHVLAIDIAHLEHRDLGDAQTRTVCDRQRRLVLRDCPMLRRSHDRLCSCHTRETPGALLLLFAFFGLGLCLYFASQGAGRVGGAIAAQGTATSDFDLRHLRKRPISIYLGVSPDELDRIAPLYNLLFQQLIDLNVRELPDETTPVPVLVILDEFARLGRASVIASAFSYVAGYGIRLLPVIQSRSQLRGVYGEHVADEIVANCGVEVAFTPKELRVANELSERIGYVGQESVTRSLTINGLLANRSKSISEQRRALMLPQELMQFPADRLILLRGGIPPIIGDKIFYFKSRFFKKRTFPPPVVPPVDKQTRVAVAPPAFRDMTDEEAEGNPAHPLTQDDIRTEDYPSFCADMLTLDRDGNVTGILAEGDENG